MHFNEDLAMRYNTTSQNGFTLIELIVSIALVGLLAAVALAQFTSFADKAKLSEFQSVLSAIYRAQHSHHTQTDSFTEDLTHLDCAIPESQWFEYSVKIKPDGSFIAEARLKSAIGSISAGEKATIDSNGEKSITGGLKQCVSNWGAPGNS
jgi:prepilin-type N-terminal cleavage/methylation domain-containing protein